MPTKVLYGLFLQAKHRLVGGRVGSGDLEVGGSGARVVQAEAHRGVIGDQLVAHIVRRVELVERVVVPGPMLPSNCPISGLLFQFSVCSFHAVLDTACTSILRASDMPLCATYG